MPRRFVLLLVAAAVVLAASALIYLRKSPPGLEDRPAGPGPVPASATPFQRTPDATPSAAVGSLRSAMEALLAKLRRGEGRPEDLEALRRLLLAADPRQAMEAILEFLKSAEDAATGQAFALGPGGTLAGSPTMRVFLMDLLGQLAKTTGSGAADAYARTVLEQKTSPDEWAISLRNVGWSEPDATAYLGAKMREMLAEPAWTAAPSSALLEAFDVIVYSGDPTFVGQLAEISQTGVPAMQRAALVAMDRLSETAPLQVMEYLNANPDLVSDHPMRRADYFAKTDLSQPAQEVALETYLDRADVGVDEKTKLLDELAAPGTFVSDTLLTSPAAPADDGTARQHAYSQLLNQWVGANRFPSLTPAIQEVQAHLAQ